MVYINGEYQCFTEDPENVLRVFDVPFFDDKCQEFVEGYRYIPAGECWTRADGIVFKGEQIVPWKDFTRLDAAQRKYEKEKLTDAENALAILFGGDAV